MTTHISIENQKQLIHQAENLLNNYPFEVTLHYMGGWKFNQNSIERDIFIGIKESDEFIPATFKIELNENLAIQSYGGHHPKINVGKTFTTS